jgi:hypothetical protein
MAHNNLLSLYINMVMQQLIDLVYKKLTNNVTLSYYQTAAKQIQQ